MRVVKWSIVAAVLALVVFASASVALAAGRVALVVGNSTYDHIGRLPNPENDAVDMAAALQRLGVRRDDRARRRIGVVLTEALRAFTRWSVDQFLGGGRLVGPVGRAPQRGVDAVSELDRRLRRSAVTSLRLQRAMEEAVGGGPWASRACWRATQKSGRTADGLPRPWDDAPRHTPAPRASLTMVIPRAFHHAETHDPNRPRGEQFSRHRVRRRDSHAAVRGESRAPAAGLSY